MSKTLTLEEDEVRMSIAQCYCQYLVAHKQKNTVSINQAYGRMQVWQGLYKDMKGDEKSLELAMEKEEKRINK